MAEISNISIPDCGDVCPLAKTGEELAHLRQSCRGLRIKIDQWQPLVQNGLVVAELAIHACGSCEAIDADTPSIPVQDYAETHLPLSDLYQLYKGGQLPDQILER